MKHLNLFYLRRHIVLLSLLVCFFVNMKAESVVVDGIKYEKTYSDSHYSYEVSGYTSDIPSDVVIPSSIESIPVTKIGERSFWGCAKMESITLPASVTIIDNWAFYHCSSLRILKIEDGDADLDIYIHLMFLSIAPLKSCILAGIFHWLVPIPHFLIVCQK